MSAPDPELMSLYGTEGVYKDKLAKKLPLSAAVAIPIIGYGLLQATKNQIEGDRKEAVRSNDDLRLRESIRNAGDIAALRGDGVAMHLPIRPAMYEIPPSDDVPLAFLKEGMEVAHEIGATLAKHAGIGSLLGAINRVPGRLLRGSQKAVKPVLSRTPGLGRGSLRTKALIGGTALLGGYGALQGGRALANAAGQPATVRTWGAGPALPRYVNQFGQPTL